MNGTESQSVQAPAGQATAKSLRGISTMEAIGAAAAIIVAVLGVAGVFSSILAPVATIVAGMAVLILGPGVGWSWKRLFARAPEPAAGSSPRPSAEFLGGLAGIVLGILALLGFSPDTLMGAAVISLGAALVLSGWLVQLQGLTEWQVQGSASQPSSSKALFLGSAGQVVIGLGAVALGILAVIGLVPLTLILVGLICLGVAALIDGILRAHRAGIGTPRVA